MAILFVKILCPYCHFKVGNLSISNKLSDMLNGILGVNMDCLPMMFSRSYPLDALRLNRDLYFDGQVVDGIPAPSSPELIASVR
jgi:hypothetical protein